MFADTIKKYITYIQAFINPWQSVLTSDAKVYNGLFGGLQRVIDNKAKNPDKVLKEWCIRTENKFGDCRVTKICNKKIMPAAESKNGEQCRFYAERLLSSAKKAGIYREKEKEIVLTEKNINAYIEWDGNEIFEDDRVEVINPAWYQNGTIIEQGHCKIIGG